MPEIKNIFTDGKMNKDLDERLVPKGQYIDAVNVEVTTSEDSDVGTVQNLNGNISLLGNESLVPTTSVCVGSVVDNETDDIYWLTADDKIEIAISPFGGGFKKANIIFRHGENNNRPVEPVFVDIHQSVVDRTQIYNVSSQLVKNTIFTRNNSGARVGMSVRVWYEDGGGVTSSFMGYVNYVEEDYSGHPQGPTGGTIITTSGSFNYYSQFNNILAIEFNSNITNWNTDTLITGINIIDDMLFWTDNESEPKKINISRSFEGTHQYTTLEEIKHTDLITPTDTSNVNKGPVSQEHITVIRPKPKHRLKLNKKSSASINSGIYGSVNFNGRVAGSNSRIVQPGDIIALDNVNILDNVSFNDYNVLDIQEGDKVFLKFNSNNVGLGDFPISKPDVVGVVTTIFNNVWPSAPLLRVQVVKVNLESYPNLSGNASTSQWALQKEVKSKNLFELKFPRFSYRYKFEDGEYSSFAPWSEVAFEPGDYQWLPKEGFNLGMVNQLKELSLQDFVSVDTPKDVIQIDLLYKDADSTNVYIIDSVKPDDPPINGTDLNFWFSEGSQRQATSFNSATVPTGNYKINSESVFAAVSPNQINRNWDTVPRKALAQEIIGNRLVYANYVKNIDLAPSPTQTFKTDLTSLYNSVNVSQWSRKSVKTMRDYQVGVAYLDEYGRETPVFTNNNSIVNIPKINSDNSNIIYSKINNLAPQQASAYKFYIKENSRRYYNLIMDRWYDAEDGDIWLSFNSHDRSKIDEESYLFLKKGHNGEKVEEDYKYKVLDISNEAPEFVRNVRKQFGIKPNQPDDFGTFNFGNGQIYNSGGTNIDAISNPSALPKVGADVFQIKKELIDQTSWMGIGYNSMLPSSSASRDAFRVRFLKYPSTTTVTHTGHGSFTFSEEPEKVSAWYKISKATSVGGNYMVQLESELQNDCNFVVNDAGTAVDTYVTIELAEEKAERLPEFDGRFFVKVLRNSSIEKHIISADGTLVAASQSIYYFNQPDTSSNYADPNSIGLQLYEDEAQGSMSPTDTTVYATVKDAWVNYFGDGQITDPAQTDGPIWFIDKLKYSGTQWGSTVLGTSFGLPAFQISDNTVGAGKGIHTAPSQNKDIIDLSFSCVAHSNSFSFPNNPFGYNNSLDYYSDFFGGTISGSISTSGALNLGLEPIAFTDQIKVGSQFRFSGDTTNELYTIEKVEVFHRWNYLDKDLWYDGTEDYNDITYVNGFDGTTSSSGTIPNLIHNLQGQQAEAANRRVTFRIHLDKQIGSYDPTSSDSSHTTNNCSIEFVETNLFADIDNTSNDPAVWETEPKEEVDIDIYYEASQAFPINLDTENISSVLSIGDTITVAPQSNVEFDALTTVTISDFDKYDTGKIYISGVNATGSYNFQDLNVLIKIHKQYNPAEYFEVQVLEAGAASGNTAWLKIQPYTHRWGRTLSWFNCYSFGNGVESDTIRDDFNQIEIGNGVTASTTVGWQYKEERLKNTLIFSGIYNAKTGLNELNQFIESENITKDTNPSYGSIQKLHGRDSDLVAFCEDKVLKILANKDALFNADENPNLISSTNVLGQVLPFVGDYGISKNPESFAKENFRSYFADKKRGAVLRLSRDGITPISENGMKDWFRDNLKDDTNQRLIGSYDNHKSHYNLALVGKNTSVVFNERSKGWTSFRTFVPESGESMNNDYFTFKKGKIYKHHVGNINEFYNAAPATSSIKFVFNDQPSIVKSFKTLNYEGTQSRVLSRDDDNEYINLNAKSGWYCENIITDKQEGKVKEFVEKEGKWFNYIMGETTTMSNLDTREFSFQGIDVLAGDAVLIADQLHYGCEVGVTTSLGGAAVNINDGTQCLEEEEEE